MKKYFLLLIFGLLLLLSSCNSYVKYENVDDLLKDYKNEAEWYIEQGYEISSAGMVLGRYGNGYLMVVNATSGIPEIKFKSTFIDGIEIFHTDEADFIYYMNSRYGYDSIYLGLENIYNHGFLSHDDLLDIQLKFNEWKDQQYPYSVGEHYPID